MSAFSIPLSGLEASSSSLNTIANNLANLNTDGYKDQTLNFADVFNQVQATSGNGDPIQTGSGVQTAGTTVELQQWQRQLDRALRRTWRSRATDSSSSNSNGTDYTRAGDFTVNSAGQLTTQSGELVMGYPATNGVVSTSWRSGPDLGEPVNHLAGCGQHQLRNEH